ncbi:hypothetical protein GCM10023185_09520 [Hymenobacter saemangeumensis]|uniref:T9SS type A sorting domain-containing protein n=1 Tax=Hymenobacter saemangeumensis TaxID=1084522 RepID=A0ABP8I4N2_9BACT
MKFLRAFILLVGLFLGSQPVAQAQHFEWARLARTLTNNGLQTTAGATDAQGNTYVAFDFQDSVRVGSRLYRGVFGASLLVRYDSTGQVSWVTQLQHVGIQHMAVDRVNGGVYMSGRLNSGAAWGGASVPTTQSRFYGKFSATGALLWMRGLPNSTIYGITADGQGKGYLQGITDSVATAVINGVSLNNTVSYLFQFDASGSIQWLRQLHGDGPASVQYAGPAGVNNIALGSKANGGCLVVGTMFSKLYFAPGTSGSVLNAQTSRPEAFIANFDPNGNLLWARQGHTPNGTAGQVFSKAAAGDAGGNCYLSGGSTGVATFGQLTSQRGFFLLKYDSFGTPIWLRGQQANTGSNGNETGTHLVVDNAGQATLVVNAQVSPNNGPSPTVLGPLQMAAPTNIVRYSAQGQELWTVADSWLSYTTQGAVSRATMSVEATSLGLDARGRVYYTGRTYSASASLNQTITFGAHTLLGRGMTLTKIGAQPNSLLGQVYFDANSNGVRDAGEGIFQRTLTAELSQAGFSSYHPMRADGKLQAYASSGAYSLSLVGVPANYVVTQPANNQYTGTFTPGGGQRTINVDFGVAPRSTQPDVRVMITPVSLLRTGVPLTFRVSLENMGAVPVAAGTVSFTPDARLSYISSAPTATWAGGSSSWSYTNLQPGEARHFDVRMSIPINVSVGTLLTFTAQAPLAADSNPADNSAGHEGRIIGSYDPNDISVNYSRLTPSQVAAGQPLDYTIRFQNMGTDTAFAVVISDTVDFRKLSVGSLQLVSQSHNCYWSITSRGILTVRFLNILLPHRQVDAIRSQGYVRFRVRPITTLGLGDIIPNRAHIVFDYNPPVTTNTATTTVLNPTALLASHSAASWEAYPNPATEQLTLAAELRQAGPVRLQLLDVLGRPVQQQTLAAPAGPLHQTLSLKGLAPGLYVLRVTLPDGKASTRTVVKE